MYVLQQQKEKQINTNEGQFSYTADNIVLKGCSHYLGSEKFPCIMLNITISKEVQNKNWRYKRTLFYYVQIYCSRM